MTRDLDLVLFGATGYTGGLVAAHVKGTKLRVALAGRDEKKLAARRSELGVDWPIVLCDAMQARDVGALAERARVVCTTVGPYLRYGAELAAACAEHGTHYCDLTGETPFMRASIDRNHDVAKRTGARVVHACGFDSIPSDLGTFATWRAAQGDALTRVRARLVRARGKPSGGTAASLFAILERVRDPEVRRALGDPHALDPVRPHGRSPDTDLVAPKRDERGHWLGPFFMAPVNTRVVRRTYGLLDRAYGERFVYEEVMDCGEGAKGLMRASQMSGVMIGALAMTIVPGLAAIARRFAPKPGEGPTREERERGFFRFEIDAETEGGARLETVVADDLDPGYGSTSKMLGETALCLCEDDLRSEGGVLTPASAMGDALLARLRRAGMTFSTERRS